MDSVKLISPSISDANDPSCYMQDSYSISDSNRLLLRFEELSQDAPNVVTNGQTVQFTVTLENSSDSKHAATDLRLCYLTTDWMMLATWTKAHPFGGDQGSWSQPGGDYSQCISPSGVDSSGVASFDVTTWFINDIQDRGTNDGFILMASDIHPIVIYGDKSMESSPRMLWNGTVSNLH